MGVDAQRVYPYERKCRSSRLCSPDDPYLRYRGNKQMNAVKKSKACDTQLLPSSLLFYQLENSVIRRVGPCVHTEIVAISSMTTVVIAFVRRIS